MYGKPTIRARETERPEWPTIGQRLKIVRNYFAIHYCNLAYSAWACFSMEISGSASFQRVRKSWYAVRALVLSPCMA